MDRDLEDAARVDGATERQLFRSITIPLAGAALAAGLVMSWARALGEFGATIMFAGNVEGRTQTLPLVVYSEFQGGDLDQSIAAAAILVIAAFGVLVAVRFFHWGRPTSAGSPDALRVLRDRFDGSCPSCDVRMSSPPHAVYAGCDHQRRARMSPVLAPRDDHETAWRLDRIDGYPQEGAGS